MGIINISRQAYSSGDKIAHEIAERINYNLIDKVVINNKVKEFHCNFSKEFECDFSDEIQDLANEKEPGFFKHFFKNPAVYNCILQAILFEAASQGNMVILGRGAQFVLDQTFVLNIRIVAPFDVRCMRLEKEEQVNRSMAEKLLEKKDHERENFIQYLLKRNIADADAYDLVFNEAKFDSDAIVAIILNCMKIKENKMSLTDKDKDLFKRLALEKRVEATIRRNFSDYVHLKVECEKLGDIKLSGFASDEMEQNKMFKLAKLCNGVNSVDNNLDSIRLHKP